MGEPPVMDQTAVATQIVPTQTRTCSLEPWLGDQEKQMTTTMTQGTTVMNEVALDYNSGFQMAVAGLLNEIKDSTTVPPTAPPTAAPTDGTTTGTTKDPNNNCPGGNLEACISLCPEEDADIYQACVHGCMENC